MLKNLLKFSLIGCLSFILLLAALIAGLMVWDYIDQKLAERETPPAQPVTPSSEPTTSA
ncbi:MAG: hypothetical protein M1396_04315 [Chloroflexi bacterium]|nr:hypothetical protein [Chloroflexota bacterium]MCL5947003.1 hypothetical protein [Chloroflexota bacterium]